MFEPYHRFQASAQLERQITELSDAGQVTDAVVATYHRYHFAIQHKLRSAMDHLLRLVNVLDNPSDDNIVNSGNLLLRSNMALDAFLYCGGSALDILAREVLGYFAIAPPANVYYQTARQILQAQRPGDPLLPRLADPTWRARLSDLRNVATHEEILANEVVIRHRIVGHAQVRQASIPLPDDPHLAPEARTYSQDTDVVAYCETQFRRLVSHVNVIYADLADRAEQNGSLPF